MHLPIVIGVARRVTTVAARYTRLRSPRRNHMFFRPRGELVRSCGLTNTAAVSPAPVPPRNRLRPVLHYERDGDGSSTARSLEVADAATGSPAAFSRLDGIIPVLYAELRGIAHRQLMGGRGGMQADRTLATTALVNEAYLKLAGSSNLGWTDRPHFLATAALAMRQILVDRARGRASAKRGGGLRSVTLDEQAIAITHEPDALLDIDDALTRLAGTAPRLARVVECRFYGGMSEQETAAALDVTVRTVQRDWVKARMLLRRALLR